MSNDHKDTATQLVKLIGKENIISVMHCQTRLRFTLKDLKKPNQESIERLNGVIRVIVQGGQFQVVIGTEVSNVYSEILKLGDFQNLAQNKEENNKNLLSMFMDYVSGSMAPLFPALLGCGMINLVLLLLTNFNIVNSTSSTYIIISSLGNTIFYFLPIYLAHSAAKKVGVSPFLVMTIAGLLIHPNIIALLSAGNSSFFGIPVVSASYASSVIPILIMAPIMKYIEKFMDKISPSMFRSILTPLVTLAISAPIALICVGPLGTIIGNGLANGIDFLYTRASWLTIMMLSAFMPFIIMTGMHLSLTPLLFITFAANGFDPWYYTTMLCSNMAQGGATLAVGAKSKDPNIRSSAFAAGISAIVGGITEPALYGITLKYKKPMFMAMIAAAISGLFGGIMHVVVYAVGNPPSMLSIFQMIGGESNTNVINGIIMITISIIVSFALTYLFFQIPEESPAGVTEAPTDTNSTPKSLVQRIDILTPITGTVVEMSAVNDKTFSENLLGEGVAIQPNEGKVYAPADGIIVAFTETHHAIALRTEQGTEILIHIGLDTVVLNGNFFTPRCKHGDSVKAGDILLEFDIEQIRKAGYDLITPVIIVNTKDYVSIKSTVSKEVKKNDVLLMMV